MRDMRITNALINDKGHIGINEEVRQSLKVFYSRAIFMDPVEIGTLVTIVDDEDLAIEKNANHPNNYDYLILTWEGNIPNIYMYHTACMKHVAELETKTNGEWLVTGHIMDQQSNRMLYKDPTADRWQGSYFLFPITAIINLKKYRELGMPKWGQISSSEEHVVPIRSIDNIHDNYTPLYLKGHLETVTTPVKKGWNIIDVSLRNNLPVYNLSNEIRTSQTYLYPENDPKVFNTFWETMHSMPKLPDNYNKVFQNLLQEKVMVPKKWACFIKNTEEIYAVRNEKYFYESIHDVTVLMMPCAGFKDFIVASKKTRESPQLAEVIHFDIFEQCVDIRQRIIENWNGRRETLSVLLNEIRADYAKQYGGHECFHMHSMKSLDDVYPEIIKHFDSEEELERQWLRFQQVKHTYITCDILTNPEMVTRYAKNRCVYICMSDIAGWRVNLISFGYKLLRQQLSNIATNLQKNNCWGVVDFKDPATDHQDLQDFKYFVEFLKRPIEE